MSRPKKWDYPPDDEIRAGIEEHGSQAAYARSLGIPVPAMNKHCSIHGIVVGPTLGRREPIPGPEIDDPLRIRLDRAKEENRVLRKENKAYAKKLASQQEFFEEIVEATKVEVDVPRFKVRQQDKKLPENSILSPMFDMQFGQFVRPSDTPGGRGDFNEEVFDARLSRWVNAVCEIAEARARNYRIDEWIIPLGGDQVEGDEIFPGQAWQLEFGPPRQVWELTLKLDAALREVIRFAKTEIGVPYIALYAVPGNHGKVGGKKSGARPSDYSWDWLHHMMLFDRLRAEPVDQFAIEPGGSLFFYCAGHEFQAIHGDEIRGWGGLPFYGLTRFDGRSMRLHNRMYGITEQPYGSNWGPHIEDWIRYTGYTGPVYWCGCLTCYAVVEIGGAKIPARSRLGYDGYINADAAAGQNGLRRVSLDDARAGDVTWDFHHISTCVGPVSGGCIPSIDGNTSSDDAGSQSNGGGVFRKNRSVSSVVTVARPAY